MRVDSLFFVRGERAGYRNPSPSARALLLFASLLFIAHDIIAAESSDPRAVVQQTLDRVLGLADDLRDDGLREAIESEVGPALDAGEIARLAMGRHWRSADASQRSRVAHGVRAMLLDALTIALEEHPGTRAEVRAVGALTDAHEATVRSRVYRAAGPPVTLAFRLLRARGRWRIYDLSIEGVSMLNTYRRSFGAHIRRVGLTRFIDDLEAR